MKKEELEKNIGKQCQILDSVVAGFTNKIGTIIAVWGDEKKGYTYEVRFPAPVSPHNIDTLHPHHGMVDLIDKVYTYEDAKKLRTDIDMLHLPRRVFCDTKETLYIIAGKFAECHIGTSINYERLFIQA